MMVLIQKFDELEKASDNLRKTGYYSHWPSDYYAGTVLKRQKTEIPTMMGMKELAYYYMNHEERRRCQ